MYVVRETDTNIYHKIISKPCPIGQGLEIMDVWKLKTFYVSLCCIQQQRNT